MTWSVDLAWGRQYGANRPGNWPLSRVASWGIEAALLMLVEATQNRSSIMHHTRGQGTAGGYVDTYLTCIPSPSPLARMGLSLCASDL